MPSSHQDLKFESNAERPESWLAEAFGTFISASARLELSYRELQAKVAGLSLSIAQRDLALSTTCSQREVLNLLLHGVLEKLPCGVIVTGKDLRLVNPEAARLVALAAAHIPEFASLESREPFDLASFCLRQAALRNGAVSEREMGFVSSGGQHSLKIRTIALGAAYLDAAEFVITILEEVIQSRRPIQSGGPDPLLPARTVGFEQYPTAPHYLQGSDALGLSMEDVERRHLTHVLEGVGGNRTRAAAILKISIRTLSSKIRQYDLPRRRCA